MKTPEERRAWLRGVLQTLERVKATEDAALQVCTDLRITPEELSAFAEVEEAEARRQRR